LFINDYFSAFQPNPRAQAENMGRSLGLSWSSTQNLVDQLRAVPFQRLINAQVGWTELVVPRGFSPFDFVPCVEPVNSPEYRFLTHDPVTLMRSGNFLQMPAIIGYNDVSKKLMKQKSRPQENIFAQCAIQVQNRISKII
jgi:carboxylesterase type B